jgi:hypothetical protein
MATPILVMGNPGTGKTVSIRNLNPENTFLIVSDKKPLTIPKSKTNYKTVLKDNGKLDLQKSNYFETADPVVVKALLNQISDNLPNITTIVIDTITSIMTSEYMSRIKEKGYEKFNDLGWDTYDIITMLRPLRDDLTIVVMSHVEDAQNQNTGEWKTKFKSPGGKLVNGTFEPEALFHMVLYTDVCRVNGKTEYSFLTENNGSNTGRTPMGLFSEYKIPNDLAYVISEYKEYEK